MTPKNIAESQPELELFEKRILFCLSEHRLLKTEVRGAYLKRFPPVFIFRKKPLLSLPLYKVERALQLLASHNLIKSEIVRWHDGEPLKEDTHVYVITGEGSSFLAFQKK